MENLSKEERKAFESLPRSVIPPDSLERTTIEKLKKEELIKRQKQVSAKRIFYPIAATVLFFLGFFSSSMFNRTIDNDEAYIMILFEDDNFQAENSSEIALEYSLWNDKVNESGIEMSGQELWNEGYRISNNGARFLDADNDTRITGYFLIEAETEKEAIAVAEESPHVKYGGTIELKRFRVRN